MLVGSFKIEGNELRMTHFDFSVYDYPNSLLIRTIIRVQLITSYWRFFTKNQKKCYYEWILNHVLEFNDLKTKYFWFNVQKSRQLLKTTSGFFILNFDYFENFEVTN